MSNVQGSSDTPTTRRTDRPGARSVHPAWADGPVTLTEPLRVMLRDELRRVAGVLTDAEDTAIDPAVARESAESLLYLGDVFGQPDRRDASEDSVAASTARPSSGCGCDFMSKGDHRDHPELLLRKHEMLTTIEERGVAGVMELIEEISPDFDEDVKLHHFDLDEFVAQHNWRDPVTMFWLASWIHGSLEAQEYRLDTGTTFAAVRSAVTAIDEMVIQLRKVTK